MGELSGKGGTSSVILIVVVIFGFVATIGVLAAIALPAYQDYTARAHVTEAAKIGMGAAESVANYYGQHQAVPESLKEAGYTTPLPQFVKEVNVNSEDGRVIVTMASGPVRDKTLIMEPAIDAQDKITWTCMSPEIQVKYLPKECRQP